MPRKPRDLVPGPGQYTISPRGSNIDGVQLAKGGYIPVDERQKPSAKISGIPGPAYYNAGMEPKKISFMFNAAEKWTQ